MKYKLIAALVVWSVLCINAYATEITVVTPDGQHNQTVNDSNPFPTTSPSTSLNLGTSKNVTVTTASQLVNLASPSMNVTINNTSTTNTLYFQPFGGAASASNFVIAPGQAFSWGSRQALSSFALYASAGGTVVGVLAH